MGNDNVEVSHLQYADGTLILCNNSQRQILLLRCIIWCFKAVSRIHMNLAKSLLIFVGNLTILEQLTAALECRISHLPLTYLGFSLGSKFKEDTWNPVIDRIRRRLVGWKACYLSKGGRLTLIKAVLTSIPVYFMSLYVIPKMVAQYIEKLLGNFLWKGEDEDRRQHLVAWVQVYTLKQKGGLALEEWSS